MDGPYLLEILSDPRGGFPVWYQAGYLPLAALVELFVGAGQSLSALLWLSALGGATALTLAAVIVRREVDGRAGWWVALCLAGAPALWFHSTLVELHSVQLSGAAALLLVAVAARRRSLVTAAVMILVAQFAAGLLHNSNCLLAGGAAWVAARRLGSTWQFELRRVAVIATAAIVGALIAIYCDHVLVGHPGQRGGTSIEALVVNFSRPPSLAFIWKELVVGWAPVFALLVVRGPRDRGGLLAALPFLAGAVPGLVFFSAVGIGSTGGYFGPSALFLAVASVVGERASQGALLPAPNRWRHAILAATALATSIVGWRWVHDDARSEMAVVAEQRLQIARAALPNGGVFISLDPNHQAIFGRDPDIWEIEIGTGLLRVVEFGEDVLEGVATREEFIRAAASRGDTLAINESARLLATQYPRVLAYHVALIELIERYYVLTPADVLGYPFSIGHPR